MKVALLYTPDCPDRHEASRRLRAALDQLGLHTTDIDMVTVNTDAEATAAGFPGSPTFTVDGADLFTNADA